MTAYYNEIDPYAAQWLRNLITAGHIAPGIVDERSIEDVRPSELAGFTQCHFFAGIGVWSYALRRAGWDDSRQVWTGSCPCQPFSSAGKGNGFADQRHLWPHWFHLISQCRPAVVFGEQVASKDTGPWLDLVHTDLEAMGYAFGAVPFPSASVGAPHIRDRLYWVADANSRTGRKRRSDIRGRVDRGDAQSRAGSGGSGVLDRVADNNQCGRGAPPIAGVHHDGPCSGAGGVGDDDDERLQARERATVVAAGWREEGGATEQSSGSLGGVADLHQERRGREQGISTGRVDDGANAGWVEGHHGLVGSSEVGYVARPAGPVNGFWRAADWLLCRDGKWRPVEPGTFPLAHGAPSRVGRLRAYGNAINAEAARVFIDSFVNI